VEEERCPHADILLLVGVFLLLVLLLCHPEEVVGLGVCFGFIVDVEGDGNVGGFLLCHPEEAKPTKDLGFDGFLILVEIEGREECNTIVFGNARS